MPRDRTAKTEGSEIRFVDNNDGTVTDNKTGLMWQKTNDGVRRTWQDAIDYCKGLDLAGYRDWRCPTMHELTSIVDYELYNPAMDPVFHARSNFYWSATTLAGGSFLAWDLLFGGGVADNDGKTDGGFYVRAVRGGLRKGELK